MEQFLLGCIFAMLAKVLFIGGDYSLYYHFKYGKKYKRWYYSRETFKEFLNKEK